ncbi:MAG: N-acetyl-gamma-glutamyl-phosphate reductase [Pirellulales bacterium]|nr:N-acetyl-gamma-glutamyl-phosphate reductase [Pirellulales bacterium]
MVTRIAVMGATGYTALELLKLLRRHPEVEIVALTSRQESRPHISEVHSELRGALDLHLEPLDVEMLVGKVDVAFSCLPHAASAECVKPLVDNGVKVVDFSADYRLNNVAVYEQWYGVTHPDPDRIGKVPYGLPELFREQITGSSLIANPGCYPTSAILPLAPLVKHGIIESTGIIIDSKSGVTGAGRNPKLPFHYPECNESIKAYGVGTHRHAPEISQFVTMSGDENAEVIFTPHLVPMNRGILSTCYLQPSKGSTVADAIDVLHTTYKDEPFIRVTSNPPETRAVRHTNFVDLHVAQSGDRLVVLSCIDNLIKGASGAAVQNFNLMCGYEETTALL